MKTMYVVLVSTLHFHLCVLCRYSVILEPLVVYMKQLNEAHD